MQSEMKKWTSSGSRPPTELLVSIVQVPRSFVDRVSLTLVVQLAAAATGDVVEIFVALEAAALDSLSGAHGSPARSSTISPSADSSTATAATILSPTSLRLAPVIRAGASVIETAIHTATAASDGSNTTIITTGIPACSLHPSLLKQRGHARKTREARERRHHVVHGEVLQVKSSGSSLLVLAIGRGKVSIGVRVSPARSNVRRIKDIGIDQVELKGVNVSRENTVSGQKCLPLASTIRASPDDASRRASSRNAPP